MKPHTQCGPLTDSGIQWLRSMVRYGVSIERCEFSRKQEWDTLLSYITTVVNNSLVSGFFPEFFKSAIVRPVLNKPSLDPENMFDKCAHDLQP